ncbi:hypothetical protein DUI70_7166 [Streptomyces albus]|nr:hypothetical protein DUI70_7166 [Streptomyces albus]
MRCRRGSRRDALGRTHAASAEPAAPAGLSWKKCGTKTYPTLQCSSLKVPLDHSRPQGRQITLALSRVRTRPPPRRDRSW